MPDTANRMDHICTGISLTWKFSDFANLIILSFCSIAGRVMRIWTLKGEVFKDTQCWINISLPEDQGNFFMFLTSSSHSSPPWLEIYNVILYSLTFSSWNHSCSFMNYVHNIMFWIPILKSFFCPNSSYRKLAEAGNTPIKSTFSYSIKGKSEYFCICATLQHKLVCSCEILSLFYSTDLISYWIP